MFLSDGKIPRKLKYTTGLVIVVLLHAHIALHYVSDYPFHYKHPEMIALGKLVEEEIGLTDVRFSSFTWAVCENMEILGQFYFLNDFSVLPFGCSIVPSWSPCSAHAI
jgi:hypothetical protein